MQISEVKIGQMVKRTSYEHQGVNRGDIRKVIEVRSDSVKLEGSRGWHDPDNLDLVSDVVKESIDITPSLKHTDIVEGLIYHITYLKDNGWVIMRTESKDDEHRWTGPTIHDSFNSGEVEFEDGSDDSHGAYFGGEEEENVEVEVRYATSDEIIWLNACIEAGELVDKPKLEAALLPETGNEIKQQELKTTNMDYITVLTPDMVGKKIKCRIDGIRITDARIQLAGDYYICQDVKEANVSLEKDNRFGYKYAWSVGTGSSEDLQHSVVSAIEIVPPLFKEGDFVIITAGDVPEMEKFIGRVAILKKQKNGDLFEIDLDGGTFTWKVGKHFIQAPSEIKVVNPKELDKGQIYVYADGVIIRASDKNRCDRYVKPKGKSYDNNGGALGTSFCRTASEAEKAHLNACIEAKKYVDPPKVEELLPVSMDIDPEILAEILTKNFS
jgi:hypothetical protein